METKGYVYLFQSGSLYKIGTAIDVQKRLRSVQTGNAGRVVLIHHVPSDDPYRAEKFLHLKFGDKRIRNEWFELSQEDVDWIKRVNTISSQYLDRQDTWRPKPVARDVAAKRICLACGNEFIYDTQKSPLKKFCNDDCQLDHASKVNRERYRSRPYVSRARPMLTRKYDACAVCGKSLPPGVGPCCSSTCALSNPWAQSPEQ